MWGPVHYITGNTGTSSRASGPRSTRQRRRGYSGPPTGNFQLVGDSSSSSSSSDDDDDDDIRPTVGGRPRLKHNFYPTIHSRNTIKPC